MTDGYYDYKMDIWGYGCILFEIITKDPLFPGKN
jgi:renal tumor antigen